MFKTLGPELPVAAYDFSKLNVPLPGRNSCLEESCCPKIEVGPLNILAVRHGESERNVLSKLVKSGRISASGPKKFGRIRMSGPA